MVKLFICSLFLLISMPALAEEVEMLPDAECVSACEIWKAGRHHCRDYCPKFAYVDGHLRDTRRYYIHRNCVTRCMQDENMHYYECAARMCRVR